MKITFLAPPLNLSGGTKVIAIYSEFLRRQGHDVLVVSPPHASNSRFWRRMQRLGFPTPARRIQPPSHQAGVPVRHHLLDRPRPIQNRDVPDADVVVATWWETALWANALAPSKGRKAYFIQGYEVFDFLPLDLVHSTYRLPLRKIVVAQWLARVMAEQYDDATSIVVPNAIDPGQFFEAPRGKQARPTVGTLFHETELKGFDTALKVIEAVRQRHPDLRVVAFGSSAPKVHAGQLGDIDLVVRPDQGAIRGLYAACDVWLSCSRSEGFNLTAMEAMACSTPVVSTRTGWPVEAIQAGTNGVLAEVDDVEALADGVSSILSLPDAEWRQLSEGAARTVAGSNWDASARLFEQALESIAAS